MPYEIHIVRSTDRQLIDALTEIAGAFEFRGGAQLRVSAPDGFFSWSGPPQTAHGHAPLKELLDLDGAILEQLVLNAGDPRRDVLRITRPPKLSFDTLHIEWNRDSHPLQAERFAALVASAREKLREIKLNAGESALGPGRIDALVNARAAELHELQSIAADIVKKTHARTLELEQEFADRRKALDDEVAELKRKGQEDVNKLKEDAEAMVRERQDALTAREAELDKSEAKFARRQLRLDLLKKLQEHSDRFQLSGSTRRLRWPIFILLVAAVGATGFLTYLSFADLAAAIGNDQASWWRIAMSSAKQLFFAATFLGLATYFLRWLEGWSKRHADAEFYFKQLELDLNRASWVVEIAAEWREKEGAELPKELLAQLSNHLFAEPGFAGEVAGGEGALAQILGGASNLKLSTPGGGHLEIGRSGIRKILK